MKHYSVTAGRMRGCDIEKSNFEPNKNDRDCKPNPLPV